jgi:hypothetical protein
MVSESQTPNRHNNLPTNRAEGKNGILNVWIRCSMVASVGKASSVSSLVINMARTQLHPTCQPESSRTTDPNNNLWAGSHSSYVAAPRSVSSKPLYLSDVAALRRVDVVLTYLAWPQKTLRRLTGGLRLCIRMRAALGPRCLLPTWQLSSRWATARGRVSLSSWW